MGDTYCYHRNPIVKKIFVAMLVPTILMNITTGIASLADTVLIGYFLDDQSLSVVTFAMPLFMAINAFSALFSMGGCIAVSIDAGKGQRQLADRSFSISMELLVVTGIAFSLAGIFLMDPITSLLGAEENVFASVKLYSRIILLGAPVFLLNVGAAFFARNDGRANLAMIGMFISIVTDIVLNIIFMGPLHMGVAGAALSTVLGQLAGLFVIGTHFFSTKNSMKFIPYLDKSAFRIVQNGFSSALHFIYQFLIIFLMNHLLASMAGTDGVVVYTVVFNLSTVTLGVFEGISQTIQPMISLYYGEKSYWQMKDTMRLAGIAAVILCGLVTVVLEVFPQMVPMLFGVDDGGLIDKSVVAVRIYAASMIITTINVILGYYLQSIEQNKMASAFVTLRGFVVLLACILILGLLWGMNGLWASYLVTEILCFAICFLMIQSKRKKLEQDGTKVNLLLLETEVEAQTSCYIFDCKRQDYQDFVDGIAKVMDEDSSIDVSLRADTKAYLSKLSFFVQSSKDGYIEVNINRKEMRVIVKDNLQHGDLADSVDLIVANGSKAEYGPVLGWNRICLE